MFRPRNLAISAVLLFAACTPPGYYAARPDRTPATPEAAASLSADPTLRPCDDRCRWDAAVAFSAIVEAARVDTYLHAVADARTARQQDPRLVCIRKGESGNGGGDPWPYIRGYGLATGNGYYGAYQYNPTTWRNIARMAGRPDLSGISANQAAWFDQDEVTLWALEHRAQVGHNPWTGTRFC